MNECDSLPAFSPAHRCRARSRSHNGRLPSLSIEMLRYLREHPATQDTLEGIMVWWVSEREMKRWLAQVRASLTALVARGHLEERTAADLRVFYWPNQSRVPNEVGSRK